MTGGPDASPRRQISTGPTTFPGHAHTTVSHTIGIPHLVALLDAVDAAALPADYASAVIDDNVLGRPTHNGRLRTLRHLRELYRLDPTVPAFRALRALWDEDRRARAQLAGLLAFASDELLRATFPAIANAEPGTAVSSADLAQAAAGEFAGSLNPASLARVGRNAAASWTQTGHLVGRTGKTRATISPRPTAVAYAVYLGHLEGVRGAYLFDSTWTRWFAVARDELDELTAEATRLGYLDVRRAGGIVDVEFGWLDAVGAG